MQTKKRDQLLLEKNDYDVIMRYLKAGYGRNSFNRQDAEELEAELKKAKLMDKSKLPADVVRLNSLVTIHDLEQKKELQLKVVIPEKADIRERRISIMSPIGTALIGFRKGQTVSWKVPAGKKTFNIVEVQNETA